MQHKIPEDPQISHDGRLLPRSRREQRSTGLLRSE